MPCVHLQHTAFPFYFKALFKIATIMISTIITPKTPAQPLSAIGKTFMKLLIFIITPPLFYITILRIRPPAITDAI